jgi:hypothetical protein
MKALHRLLYIKDTQPQLKFTRPRAKPPKRELHPLLLKNYTTRQPESLKLCTLSSLRWPNSCERQLSAEDEARKHLSGCLLKKTVPRD